MKSIFRNRKAIIQVSIISLLLSLMIFFFKFYNETNEIKLSTTNVKELDYFQIYFDIGNGFNEIDSMRKNIYPGSNNLRFNLNLNKKIKSLRIDFGSGENSEIILDNINILNRLFLNDLYKNNFSSNMINSLIKKDSNLILSIDGNDPYIIISDLNIPLRVDLISFFLSLVKYFVFFFLLIVGVGVSYLLIIKYRNTDFVFYGFIYVLTLGYLILFFLHPYDFKNKDFNSIMKSKQVIYGYEVINNLYTTQTNDPQIFFENINSNISIVKIDFEQPVDRNVGIQIYYPNSSGHITGSNVVLSHIPKGKKWVAIDLPGDYYSFLRIDIGTELGVSFLLKDISVYSKSIFFLEKLLFSDNFVHLFFIAFLLLFVFIMIMKIKVIGETFVTKQYIFEIAFILFSFVILIVWAIIQPYNSCPDESMRYDVIKYVFTHNTLPHGGDPEIRNSMWGFSYAFYPYLSGLVSVVFMKIASLFSSNEAILFTASRMAVVSFALFTIFYVIQISKKIFLRLESKWLFIFLVCSLPQFTFLGSYLNNDMLSLLSVTMIIYYCICGDMSEWKIKDCIGLSVSLAICLLSYYNAYPFILFAVAFFIYSNVKQKRIIDGVKKGCLVSFLVFLLAGWWFIRNFILYDGDFIAIKTVVKYIDLYGIEYVKNILNNPPKAQVSLWYMLYDWRWIEFTFNSFIGVFGYMSIPIDNWIYKFYQFIFFIGLVGFLFYLKGKLNKLKWVLFLLIPSFFVFFLSIYLSYTGGFQPQGRYIFSILIPLMLMVSIGIENILSLSFISERMKNAIVFFLVFLLILINLMSLFKVIIPIYIV